MSRVLLAALALATGLLSGCSEDSDPAPRVSPSPSAPSSSTPPSPSASASGPVEPTLPPEAAGDDAAAAEAFVRHYWEMVNYAQATGDVDGLRALADSSCAGCTGGLNGIRETYSAGGRIDGGEITVLSAEAQRISAQVGMAYTVDVETETSNQQIREPGKKTVTYDGDRFRLQFIVQRIGGDWQVDRWDVEA